MMSILFAITVQNSTAQSDSRIKCFINQIFIGKDSLIFSGGKTDVDTLTKQVILPYQNNSIKFVYSSYSLPVNYDAEYSVYLENHDKEWSMWSNLRETRYNNLAPGNYIFHVKARQSGDDVSESADFKFYIKSPFFLTAWAFILYVFIIIIGVYMIISAYRKRFSRERNKLLMILDERTRNIIESNNRLESQKTSLNKALNDLSQLSVAGQRIIKNHNITDIGKACFVELNHFFENISLSVGVYNGPTNSLEYTSFTTEGGCIPSAFYNLDIIDNLNVWSFMNRKALVIDDYKQQVYKYISKEFYVDTTAFGSAVYIPLFDSEMTIGVLSIQHTKNYYYSQYHLSIIHNIATYLEIAIVNFSFFKKINSQKHLIEERSILLEKTLADLRQSQKTVEVVNKELEKLSIVVRNTDNAVAILDANGDYEWTNKGFSKLYGYEFEEFVRNGKNYKSALNNQEAVKLYDEVYKNAQSSVFRLPLKNKNGNTVWIQTTISPVLNSNGVITQVVAIDSDVSVITKAENEIRKQSNEIAIKNKSLTESIQYAYTIQTALMSGKNFIAGLFKEFFILNLPKDIVSGDFFWVYEKFGRTYFALVDCAGHGVPGAFVSLLGKMFLDEIMQSTKVENTPADLIKMLNKKVNSTVHGLSDKVGGIDGMDLVMCTLNSRRTLLQYAGAYRPLYMVRDGQLTKFDADRMSVGNIDPKSGFQFTDHEIPIRHNDVIFLTSDGYCDQFGAANGKKFGRKNFCEMIVKAAELPTDQMEDYFLSRHKQWKGPEMEQVDDILVVGIRIIRKDI